MASTTEWRKRKRDDAEDGSSGQVTFAVHNGDAAAVGPVLASFPAIYPPKSTKFGVYQAGPSTAEADFASIPIVVAGATKTVEYYTGAETETVSRGCKYYIGIRNKKTNVLTVRPAPVHVFSRRVKGLDDAPTLSATGSQWVELRNDLGETFGTKKAQKAIRAAERRKIDVSAMANVTDHIQESIETSTKLLPSQDDANAIAQSGRLIPPHNMNAHVPQEAYRLHDIIPEAEFNALPTPHPLSGESYDERIGDFPSNHTHYVKQHLKAILSAAKPDKKKYKILLYIACLLAFRFGGYKQANNREELQHRMRRVPLTVVDGIVSRFTETSRGSPTPTYTRENATLLLAHLFVLCLHLDDFAVNTKLIAEDLREPVSSVTQQFKVLGCKIDTLSPTELSNRGIPSTQAQNKFAVLRVPLQFPKPRVGKRR